MDLKKSNFQYNAVLKRETEDFQSDLLELFPNVSEISFQSRNFVQYGDAVKSCKKLMEDMVKGLNDSAEAKKYKVGAEVNPEHTGTSTLSKDWAENEVARFWVYDKAMEGSGKQIVAVCKSSIYAIPAEPNLDVRYN